MVEKQKKDIKKELDKLITRYRPAMRKTGTQLSHAFKTAEEDIAKMYKVAQMHVEVQMKNIERERLYYDLGKTVAPKVLNGELAGPGLEKYKAKLEKISAQKGKIEKKLKRAGKAGKAKKAAAKKKK